MNKEITYKLGDERNVDELKELWDELNQMHAEKSVHFKGYYQNFTFEERKQVLLKHAQGGEVLVVIAFDGASKIGLCAATFGDKRGTIESLYVRPKYRKERVGAALIEQVLAWLKERDPATINLRVAVGNEEVLGFYARYGFKPRTMELQLM